MLYPLSYEGTRAGDGAILGAKPWRDRLLGAKARRRGRSRREVESFEVAYGGGFHGFVDAPGVLHVTS